MLWENNNYYSKMSQGHEEEVPVTEQRSIQWDSGINVCYTSPTISSGPNEAEDVIEENTINLYEEEEQEEEAQEESDESIDWGSDSSWPDVDVPGNWGTQALESNPWSDDQKPYVNIRNYQDLTLDPNEERGVLTDRIIAACSSYLDRNPVTGKYVLCKVNLSRKMLTDIGILAYHHYLEYVDLSCNELNNIEALGQLPFLMYLNVSRNFLADVLDFKAPFNLTYVNYSWNYIASIGDLKAFWSIMHLDLSHNNICVIEGLQELKYLRHLNLSHNLIERIENLNHMHLLTLNLEQNRIQTYEEGKNIGLKTLNDIISINISYNNLRTLRPFAGIPGLQSLDVSSNNIADLMEINHLQDLIYLTEADFRDNPIDSMKYYMEVCISTIKHLYILDGEVLDATRKVSLTRSFEQKPWTEAARKSSKIITLQQINDPLLGPPIIPADQPTPPIIILVGPPGSSKGSTVRSFCKGNERLTALGVGHTTRNKTKDDIEGETYHFVDSTRFRRLSRSGEFLEQTQFLGHWYGLSENEMEKVTSKSGALVTHMDLTGALMMRSRGYKCRLVLAMPSTAEVHEEMLKEKYYNWPYGTNCVAITEIENNPSKAKEFLKDNRKFLSSSVTSIASKIVTTSPDENVFRSERMEKRKSEASQAESAHENKYIRAVGSRDSVDDEFKSIFAENMKLHSISSQGQDRRTSSRTSGILKGSLSRTKTAAATPRTSVTFQDQDSDNDSQLQQSTENVPVNRSVTFSNVEYAQIPTEVDQPPQFSISKTVVRHREHDSHSYGSTSTASTKDEEDDGLLLSVLSGSLSEMDLEKDSIMNQRTRRLQARALQHVVQEIIKAREDYLNFHYSNPGVFREVIYTDNVEEANEKLKVLLRKCVERQPKIKEHFTYNKDTVYQTMVATRLQSLHNEIRSYMSTSQYQMDESMKQSGSKPLQARIAAQNPVDVVRKMDYKRKQSLAYKLPTEDDKLASLSEEFFKDEEDRSNP